MVTNIKAIIERASNKAMVNISMQMAQFTKEICGRMRGAVMALSNLQMAMFTKDIGLTAADILREKRN